MFWFWKHSPEYEFVPQEDITAFELAYLMTRLPLGAKPMRFHFHPTGQQFKDIPENVRRHIRRVS